MTAAFIIDGLIVLAILQALYGGWRQGAFASVLSTIGVIAGLIIGAAVAPLVMQLSESVAMRFLFGLGTIVLLVGVGSLVGGILGSRVREQMRMKSSQTIDSLVGSAFTAAATLLVVWLVSIPLATALPGSLGQGIRNSYILTQVDRYTPPALAELPKRVSAMLDDSGLPPLFAPFDEPVAREVPAPSSQLSNPRMVEAVRPGVIHVLGDADTCKRRLMGSGFVASPDHVITNAHVVAGTGAVRLDTVLGVKDADVVFYNPEVDIAVLYSPDLGLPVLDWASSSAASGDDAVVMGFPDSGPFEAAPARIRERITIAGPDIYSEGRVEREAYTVRGTIRQGNSGGPMVDQNGDVLGLVFGASVDQTDTGYVLTAAEVQRQTGDVASMTTKVGTGECIAR